MPASSTAASPSPAPVIILPLLALLVGCTPGDDPRVLDGTEGEASADTDGGDTDASEAESDTDTSESDPSTDTTTGDSCPEPSEEPMLVDDPSVFCSLGFRFDATYRLDFSDADVGAASSRTGSSLTLRLLGEVIEAPQVSASTVPEPSVAWLLGAALGALAMARSTRRTPSPAVGPDRR